MNKRYGISLITLIITIVVMIILTAVVIVTLSGDDGVIAQARRARLEQLISNDITSLQMEFNKLVTKYSEDMAHVIDTNEYMLTIKEKGYNAYIEDEEYQVLMDNERIYSFEVINGQKLDLNYLGTTTQKNSGIKVILDATGGKVSNNKVRQVVGENYKDLPFPSKDGHKFVGWSTQKDNKEKIVDLNTKVEINTDHTLYAIWEPYLNISVENEFVSQGSYGFKLENGVLIPTNSHVQSSESKGYYKVDLSSYAVEDKFVLKLEASADSEAGYDIGYAIVSESTDEVNYETENGRFMYISGSLKSEYSSTLSGGKCYYIHIGYRKDNSSDTGNDRVVIHDMYIARKTTVYNRALYPSGSYPFERVGEYISSTNINVDNSVSSSYIKLVLNNVPSEQIVTYEFETLISSEADKDFGYVYVTNSLDVPDLSSSDGQKLKVSGVNKNNVKFDLNGGATYYVHFIYSKDSAGNNNDDKFKFKPVIKLGEYEVKYLDSKDRMYYFDRSGDTLISNNFSIDGSIGEIYFEIDLSKYNVDEEFTVKLTASTKSEANNDVGLANITENKNKVEYDMDAGRFMNIGGFTGPTDYTTTVNGGKKYYLHVGYRKDSTQSHGLDMVQLHDLSVAKKTMSYSRLLYPYGKYSFSNGNDGYIQSTNVNQEGTSCNSYLKINLNDMPSTEKYKFNVSSIVSSEQNGDIGYVAITESPSAPSFKDNPSTFLTTSGQETKEQYAEVDGGKTYYIHFAYVKNSSNSQGTDNVKYKVLSRLGEYELYYNNDQYIFVQQGDNLVSTNKGDNTETRSYLKIDLSEYSAEEDFIVKLNASVSSEANCDIGFANITKDTNKVDYNNSQGRFMQISGVVDHGEYSTTIKGGEVYYLHIGYVKDGSRSDNADRVVFHDLKVEKK